MSGSRGRALLHSLLRRAWSSSLPAAALPANGVDQGSDRSLEMLEPRVELRVVAPVLHHTVRSR